MVFISSLTFLLFLLISIYHFGSCDANFIINKIDKLIISIAHGGSVVMGVIYFQKDISFQIFEYLSGSKIYLFFQFVDYFFYFILIFICFYFYFSLKNKKLFKNFIEMNLILLIAFFAHPLVTFSIYFCCIHTPRHIVDVIKNLRKKIKDAGGQDYISTVYGGGYKMMESYIYYQLLVILRRF